jgi:hypothetical protein
VKKSIDASPRIAATMPSQPAHFAEEAVTALEPLHPAPQRGGVEQDRPITNSTT